MKGKKMIMSNSSTKMAKNMNQPFWTFVNLANGKGELRLYGPISDTTWWGDEVTPKQFIEDLQNLGDVSEIDVRINSGGGDVFAALTIANNLKDHKATIHVIIDGWAASAATIIAMAGDKITVPTGSMMMIHNPALGIYGYYTADEFDSMAEELEKVKSSIVDVYYERTNLDKKTISKLMDNETWLTAQEAVDYGFADEKNEENPINMSLNGQFALVNGVQFDVSTYQNYPKNTGKSIGNRLKISNFSAESTEIKGENEMEIKNLADLKEHYPEIYNEALKDGAAKERKRIQDIEEVAVDGFADLVNEAKYSNPMDAGELAIAMLKMSKKQGEQYITNAKKEAEGIEEIEPAKGIQNTKTKKEKVEDEAKLIANFFPKKEGK